jgi:hypothetical protein
MADSSFALSIASIYGNVKHGSIGESASFGDSQANDIYKSMRFTFFLLDKMAFLDGNRFLPGSPTCNSPYKQITTINLSL